MTNFISKLLKLRVGKRAKYCCEYCLVQEYLLATIFHIDHIRSIKHGGKTTFENLAYACPHCNQHKGSDIATFVDEDNELTIRLFNPRKDKWHDHFENNNGLILPKTDIAKGTIQVLNMNQIERVIFRQALTFAGIYPPFN
jgi:HNH endonuclease